MSVTTMGKDKVLFIMFLSYVKHFEDDRRQLFHTPTGLTSIRPN